MVQYVNIYGRSVDQRLSLGMTRKRGRVSIKTPLLHHSSLQDEGRPVENSMKDISYTSDDKGTKNNQSPSSPGVDPSSLINMNDNSDATQGSVLKMCVFQVLKGCKV